MRWCGFEWYLRSQDDILWDITFPLSQYLLKVTNVPLQIGDVVEIVAGFHLMDKGVGSWIKTV